MARKEAKAGVKDVHATLPDVDLEEIVTFLRTKTWVAPKGPGIRGCDPCRSGLDRLVIEDPAFRGVAR
jgi:hypothetical protein